MSYHTLRAPAHGVFDAGRAPVLTVDSGDVVELATLDANWHTPEQDDLDGELSLWAGRDLARDPGHALAGPIAVAGAQPGDVVAVTLLEVVPGNWGWTRAGGWGTWINDGCGVTDEDTELLRWRLADGRGVDQYGDAVALRPFLGVIGLCPAGPGPHSTVPPRRVGGNLDCRELVVGSTLLLPVEVAGALLSVGDGHAAQGDGESGGTALECPMTRVLLRVELRPGDELPLPRASTPAGKVTFGVDRDLNAATVAALNAMVDLLVARRGITRPHALALCSVGVDLRITQVVNQVSGVHAVAARI